jgi:hypothetical protein
MRAKGASAHGALLEPISKKYMKVEEKKNTQLIYGAGIALYLVRGVHLLSLDPMVRKKCRPTAI